MEISQFNNDDKIMIDVLVVKLHLFLLSLFFRRLSFLVVFF